MKRIIALALVLLLTIAGTAQASEWAEGLSPSRPYTDQPEVDLNEQLGYMLFYPNAQRAAQHMCQRLYVYLPRQDVHAGEGTLYLFTETGDAVWNCAMNDTAHVTRRDITEDERDWLLWGSGVCFEIVLPRTLDLGQTYVVNMTRGCIVTDQGAESSQIGGEDAWRFTVEGEYGVGGMEYRRMQENGRYEEGLASPQTGDEVRFDLVLDGDAAMASIYQYNGSMDFLTTVYTQSAEVTGTVTAESPYWGIIFLDAEGSILKQVAFW